MTNIIYYKITYLSPENIEKSPIFTNLISTINIFFIKKSFSIIIAKKKYSINMKNYFLA